MPNYIKMEEDIDVDNLTTCKELRRALNALDLAEYFPNQQIDLIAEKKRKVLQRLKDFDC